MIKSKNSGKQLELKDADEGFIAVYINEPKGSPFQDSAIIVNSDELLTYIWSTVTDSKIEQLITERMK